MMGRYPPKLSACDTVLVDNDDGPTVREKQDAKVLGAPMLDLAERAVRDDHRDAWGEVTATRLPTVGAPVPRAVDKMVMLDAPVSDGWFGGRTTVGPKALKDKTARMEIERMPAPADIATKELGPRERSLASDNLHCREECDTQNEATAAVPPA